MKIVLTLLTFAITLLVVPATRATMVMYDVDLDASGWMMAIFGTTASTAYDFDLDANYPGAPAFFGPLTSTGAGPVSPGTISSGVSISSLALNPVIIADLFAIGPSSLGNSANTLYSNQLNNGLAIDFADPVTAFEFNVLANGSDYAHFRFFDAFGSFEEITNVPVDGGNGHRLGILGVAGTLISRIEIFVPATGGHDGNGGHEGLTRDAVMYRGQTATVSAPSSGLLLAVGLIAMLRGHSRTSRTGK